MSRPPAPTTITQQHDQRHRVLAAPWLDLRLELVVARYEESLNWMRKVPLCFGITVYDKGASQGDASILPASLAGEVGGRVRIIPLPNVGREAHSYLHHIRTRLEPGSAVEPDAAQAEPPLALADATVFCQGRPFDHAFDFHHTLRLMAQHLDDVGQWRWLGHIIDTDTREGALFLSWSKNHSGQGLDLEGFHRALLGSPGPTDYAFVLGGQFWARREPLQRRGLGFWERALQMSTTWPEAAHCFERCWDLVLGLPGPDPAWMDGRRTIHLKKIRGDQRTPIREVEVQE